MKRDEPFFISTETLLNLVPKKKKNEETREMENGWDNPSKLVLGRSCIFDWGSISLVFLDRTFPPSPPSSAP